MTIKELSEKCGISEQSLRAWCKKNNVSKTIIEGNERKATKPSYVITKELETEILDYYGCLEKNETQATKERKAKKETKEGNERKATKEKKDDNSTVAIENELIKQLRIKDEQIAALQEQNRLLIENNSILTTALNTSQQSLQTEQALHAGTIKKQLTDTSGSGTEKKQNILKRLFVKKQ